MALLAFAPAAGADVWDVSVTGDDDSALTDNEMVHGVRQVHDLAAVAGTPDEDWFQVPSFGFGSHEVVVDSTTGDVGPYRLDRVTSSGGLIQAGIPIAGGTGDSRSVRWFETSMTTITQYVRVSRPACRATCTDSDQYSVRYYETTGSMLRYNNTGSQATVVLLQNPTTYTIRGYVHFWNSAGTYLGPWPPPPVPPPFTLPPKQEIVLNLSTLPYLAGTSGHITVAHDGRYDDLKGAAITITPASGFEVVYPMVSRLN
jgi:hypothetical protein